MISDASDRVTLLDAVKGKTKAVIHYPGFQAISLALSSDPLRMVCGMQDGTIHVWDVDALVRKGGVVQIDPCTQVSDVDRTSALRAKGNAIRPPRSEHRTKVVSGSAAKEKARRKRKSKNPRLPKEATALVRKLASIGWFEALPSKARRHISQQIGKAVSDNEKPWHGLSSVSFDGEGLEYGGAYIDLLREFERGSYGLFNPEDIDEEGEGRPLVSFTHGGKQYRRKLDDFGDYFDLSVIRLVNEALKDAGCGIEFIGVDTGGQDCCYVLADKKAYAKAVRDKMIPRKVKS